MSFDVIEDRAVASPTIVLTSTDGGAQWRSIDLAGVPPGAFATWIGASDDGAAIYLGTQSGL